jgi:DNA-directed RNA polymerase subunit beta'
MAIHLPISKEAVAEARVKMLASNNIIAPKDGKPIVTPTIDMLVGTYYATTEKHNQIGEGSVFSNEDEVARAFDLKRVNIHTIIAVSTNAYAQKGLEENKFIITSVGKVLFNTILPAAFPYVNGDETIDGITNADLADSSDKIRALCEKKELSTPIAKSGLSRIIFHTYKLFQESVARTVDGIKDLGFKYATQSGISFSIFDLPNYTNKDKYIEKAREQVANLKEKYSIGFLTDDERYARTLDA